MNLPGAKATAFRTILINCWVRVFGGDLTLIDEICEHHETQIQLPTNHPTRAFHDAVQQQQRNSTASPNFFRQNGNESNNKENQPPVYTPSAEPQQKKQKLLTDFSTNTPAPTKSSRKAQDRFCSLVRNRVRFTSGGEKCETTGAKLDLEVAHIIPYAHEKNHGTWATNGLLLHQSVHKLWDMGHVILHPDPPFKWTVVNEAAIRESYGTLANSLMNTFTHASLRTDILHNMSTEDRKAFLSNLRIRYDLDKAKQN